MRNDITRDQLYELVRSKPAGIAACWASPMSPSARRAEEPAFRCLGLATGRRCRRVNRRQSFSCRRAHPGCQNHLEMPQKATETFLISPHGRCANKA